MSAKYQNDSTPAVDAVDPENIVDVIHSDGHTSLTGVDKYGKSVSRIDWMVES